MDRQGLTKKVWRKSSYSGGNAECIEVGSNLPGLLIIRDSKNPDGPELTFTWAQWESFMSQLKGL